MLRVSSFICCALSIGFVGCGDQTANHTPAAVPSVEVGLVEQHIPGRVAVIDLDLVATRLGRDVEILNAIKSRHNTLAQQLEAIKLDYEKQIVEKQQEIGEAPSPDQTEALTGMRNDALQKLAQVQNQARENLTQHSSQVISQFREQVKAVAREIAASRGADVVFTRNDSVVFSYEPTVDITEDVISAMVTTYGSSTSVSQDESSETAIPNVATQPAENEYR